MGSPVYRPVTKADAKAFQSIASAVYPGGIVPKHAFAAAVQSAADKNANLAVGEAQVTFLDVLMTNPPTVTEVQELQGRVDRQDNAFVYDDTLIPQLMSAARSSGLARYEDTEEEKYVTKRDAAHQAQAGEGAHAHGGVVAKDSEASKLQSAADETEELRSWMRTP